MRLRKFFARCNLGELEQPLPVWSLAGAAPTASRRPGFCTSYRVSFRKYAASKYASAKPHTLPSALAPTRLHVLQKSCRRFRTSRSYQRIWRRLIPGTIASGQRQLAKRSAPGYVPANEPKSAGSAPTWSTSSYPLFPAGRLRPHDTRPYGRPRESAVGAGRGGSRPCAGNTRGAKLQPCARRGGRAGCRGSRLYRDRATDHARSRPRGRRHRDVPVRSGSAQPARSRQCGRIHDGDRIGDLGSDPEIGGDKDHSHAEARWSRIGT